jgi:hypothetical protein
MTSPFPNGSQAVQAMKKIYRCTYYIHFQVTSMPGLFTLYFFRWQHLSDADGCLWMTEACLKLNIYENGRPRDHWCQIQIAKTEAQLGCFIDGLCVGWGSEGLLWGG